MSYIYFFYSFFPLNQQIFIFLSMAVGVFSEINLYKVYVSEKRLKKKELKNRTTEIQLILSWWSIFVQLPVFSVAWKKSCLQGVTPFSHLKNEDTNLSDLPGDVWC